MKRHDAKLPSVVFVVPVCNDAVRLARCLKSIRASWYPPDRFSIMVVDNGSSDGSADVARELGANVMVIRDVPVAELRNRAAENTTSDIIAYIDADNEIVRGWISSGVETLQLPLVAAVGALYHAPLDGTWVQRAYGYIRGCAAGRQDAEWLGSGNLAVWRSAFEFVRGFDTTLQTCEDVDLCRRLRAGGWRVVSDERLKNIHHGDPATLWELFKGELWRGRDNLRVSLRRPLAWRALVTAFIPVADIMLVGGAVTGALLLANSTGLWLVAAAALIASVPAWIKVTRAARRQGSAGTASFIQALTVACVYDLGRALALVTRTPHRGKRVETWQAP